MLQCQEPTQVTVSRVNAELELDGELTVATMGFTRHVSDITAAEILRHWYTKVEGYEVGRHITVLT